MAPELMQIFLVLFLMRIKYYFMYRKNLHCIRSNTLLPKTRQQGSRRVQILSSSLNDRIVLSFFESGGSKLPPEVKQQIVARLARDGRFGQPRDFAGLRSSSRVQTIEAFGILLLPQPLADGPRMRIMGAILYSS